MNIDRDDASITLTADEGAALFDDAKATADMLRSDGPAPYKTFRDKLDHAASELHYETDRTVLIYIEDQEIGRYKYNGLELDR